MYPGLLPDHVLYANDRSKGLSSVQSARDLAKSPSRRCHPAKRLVAKIGVICFVEGDPSASLRVTNVMVTNRMKVRVAYCPLS